MSFDSVIGLTFPVRACLPGDDLAASRLSTICGARRCARCRAVRALGLVWLTGSFAGWV